MCTACILKHVCILLLLCGMFCKRLLGSVCGQRRSRLISLLAFFLAVLPVIESRVLKSPDVIVPGVEPLPWEQAGVAMTEAHYSWPHMHGVDCPHHEWCLGGRTET